MHLIVKKEKEMPGKVLSSPSPEEFKHKPGNCSAVEEHQGVRKTGNRWDLDCIDSFTQPRLLSVK